MSKRIIISEEEKNDIKSLYNINEQGAGDVLKDLMTDLIFGTGDDDDKTTTTSTGNISSDDECYKSILKCIGAEPTRENLLFMYA
jgi:hypothetical protein